MRDDDLNNDNHSIIAIIKKLLSLIIAALTGALISQHFNKKKNDKVYQSGFEDGFEDASEIYNEKLKDQTDKFLSEKIVLSDKIEEYEKLIADYDKYIDTLSDSTNPKDKESLRIFIDSKEKLLALPKERRL